MAAKTENPERMTIVVSRAHLVIAVITVTVLLGANIIAFTRTFTEVRELAERNSASIETIKTIDIPGLDKRITHLTQSELQLVEIRVNLQTLMRRQGIPYESVLRVPGE